MEANDSEKPGWIRRRRAWRAAGTCVLVVVLAGTCLFAWTWRRNPAPRVVHAELTPTKAVHIGDPVSFAVEIECPWSRIPLLPADITLPPGVQELPPQRRRFSGLGLGVWQWTCRLVMQPYALGRMTGGKVRLHLTADRTGAQGTVDALIPEFAVAPRLKEATEKLTLAARIPASAITSRRSWWQWAVLALVVLTAAGITVWLFRRRDNALNAEHVRPPWEVAGIALQELEESLPMSAKEFFVRLTDIVRTYVESRFQLRAREQTTPEFLAALRKSNVLSVDQRAMLTNFLTAADLVKFARAEATQDQLRDALGRAARFIAETRPRPEQDAEQPAAPSGGAVS